MGSVPLPPIILRYGGTFDLDGLYAAVTDWAKNYGYRWHEKSYKHKVPTPEGAEQELEWDLSKNVTEYINYFISFKIHIWDLKEVKINEKELSNARMQITMNGKIDYDWQKKFSGSRFKEWLGKKYEWNLKGEVGMVHFDQLYYRMWNLHALIKKYFEMQTKKHMWKEYLKEG